MAEQLPDDWRRRWPPMSYWVRTTVAVALTLSVLAAARSVLDILILVLVAAVLAVGLDRAVRLLERARIRRGGAVALIFIGAVALVALFAALVVPPLVREAGDLANNIPDYVHRLEQRDDSIGSWVRQNDLSTKLKDFAAQLPQKASRSFTTILGITGQVASVVFNLLTIAILTIYFLLSMPRMNRASGVLFSPARREVGERVLSESLAKVGGFVSGNLLTSLIAGIASLIAFLVFGIPFGVALAMWVAIADLIPVVGATLGAIPGVIVAFFSSPLDGVAVLSFFVVYQQVENYYIVPKVMKGAVDLSPAAVIVSTLIGGSLAGFAGAILALPVAATIKVVVSDVWLRDRLGPEPVGVEPGAAEG
jgi:predicted PurR-regulated permease PerM